MITRPDPHPSDGLLVAGAPKGSTWKLTFVLLEAKPSTCCLSGGVSVLSLPDLRAGPDRPSAAPLVPAGTAGPDEARSDWINGISHDIRTP